jgi:predicted MFS family arabinose efflux permease
VREPREIIGAQFNQKNDPSPMQAPAAPGRVLSMSGAMVALFAFCCGAIVANLYYSQPIIELIAPDIGLSPRAASLTVSVTQIGYALGLFFIVPLADLVENRKLLIVTASISVASLAIATVVRNPGAFLAVSLLIGFTSVSVQILVPLAAHFAPDATRGRIVGNVMSGLLVGILLSRPFASFVADHLGWHAVFMIATALNAAIVVIFVILIPRRVPDHEASYPALLRSLWTLFAREPVLRRRAFYQACMFASFSLFWTAAPLELSRNHGFSQSQIALFALIGALGAISAPIAGRMADAGHGRAGSITAMSAAAVGFLPVLVVPADWQIGALVVTGVVIDFCAQMNMVLGQREIYALDPASRGRLNALYVTSIFIGGAGGSLIASPLYATTGWTGVVAAASLFPLIALARLLLSER